MCAGKIDFREKSDIISISERREKENMAERKYFYIKNGRIFSADAAFGWAPGFAITQKRKNIAALHEAIRSRGRTPLEVSTKSTEELGRKLSAFSLEFHGRPLECVFQSSKVFANGGPYLDLLEKQPKEAKKDPRLASSGRLACFRHEGADWGLEPKTAFYDYIYYNAVRAALAAGELEELGKYDAFTDIEFNANKSLNTQARSAAIAVLAYRLRGELPAMAKEEFLEMHRELVRC